MKNKGVIITLIVLLSILVLGIISLLVFFLTGSRHVGFISFGNSVSTELVFDKVYQQNFDEVTINTSTGNIEIKVSKDEDIHVRIYGDKERTNVEEKKQQLFIETKSKKCFGFCFNQKMAKVEVELPASFENKINIKNNYGDVAIASFLNANIKVDEDAGDVSILGGREVIVDNHYGDIEIEEAKEIKVKESAGDVSIGKVEKVQVENNYGDIKIREVTGSMDIEQDCGDVKVEKIDLTQNSSIENNLGEIKIGSTNEIYIDAKTSLGDVKINENYTKSDITLKLKNSCGDIRVDN